MTLDARWIRRARARTGAAALPLLLAGCTFLFPPRTGAGGGSATSAAPAAPMTSGSASGASAPAATATVFARASSSKPGASLYSRLGGPAGLAAFTDDFLGRATNDPVVIPFFRGLTDADLARIRQHVIELLCSATGGGCVYSGKDMKSVHAQMDITNDVWNAFTGHLNETVARFRIADRERNELVVIVASLRKDIVNR
ncbi:MAG: group 1 truncated hemoglobin [Gemmatimonadales bacterium]